MIIELTNEECYEVLNCVTHALTKAHFNREGYKNQSVSEVFMTHLDRKVDTLTKLEAALKRQLKPPYEEVKREVQADN